MFTANTTLMLVATFLPLLGALVLIFVPKDQRRVFEIGSLLVMIASLLLSLPFWFGYDRASDAVQWFQAWTWIPALGVKFAVGMDGISLLLWLLTTFIGPIAIACSLALRMQTWSITMAVRQPAANSPKTPTAIMASTKVKAAIPLGLDTNGPGKDSFPRSPVLFTDTGRLLACNFAFR